MSATTELAKPEQKVPPIAIEGGLVKCNDISEAYRYANYIVKSGFAPQCFKTPEAVLIAVQYGAEVGLKPMQALQSISVVNGRPGLWGKALPGIVLQHGILEKFNEWTEGEGENVVAICEVKRKGMDTVRVEKFGALDAKKAGLWGKTGPWSQYPKDMLKYKARARAFNALFADVLCGLPVLEDIQDVPPVRRDERPAQPIADPLLKQVGAEVLTAEVSKDVPGQMTLEDLSINEDVIPN